MFFWITSNSNLATGTMGTIWNPILKLAIQVIKLSILHSNQDLIVSDNRVYLCVKLELYKAMHKQSFQSQIIIFHIDY